ncbi:MAG: dolichyl-phosphate beta-glucosyltransferase [Alyxoria varia]|nr:MAG: dolichyl-phosphate beta-glucosyltransferase [Alyxoria varia]
MSVNTLNDYLVPWIELAKAIPWTLWPILLLGIAVVAAAILYSIVYVSAQIPRPPYASEQYYTTVEVGGKVIEPRPLPCWHDKWHARRDIQRRTKTDDARCMFPNTEHAAVLGNGHSNGGPKEESNKASTPDSEGSNLEPAEVYMTVVVPAFNEEERIRAMLDEAVKFLVDEYGDNQSDLGPAHTVPTLQDDEDSPATKRRRMNNTPKAGNGEAQSGSMYNTNGKPQRQSFSGRRKLPSLGWEILIVSDGSTDRTTEIVYAFTRAHAATFSTPTDSLYTSRPGLGKEIPFFSPDSIRVINLESNRGKGGAVVHGMRHARGQYVVFADADGATKFSDLRTLLRACHEEEERKALENGSHFSKPHDDPTGLPPIDQTQPVLAIGSRAHLVHSPSVVRRSFLRNALMHAFHVLLRVLTTPATSRIKDTQCGFKLFTRSSLPLIVPCMHSEGWIFDVEMLMLAERGGVVMRECPVGWKEVKGSKLSVVWDSAGMAWGLAVLRLAWGFGIYRTGLD